MRGCHTGRVYNGVYRDGTSQIMRRPTAIIGRVFRFNGGFHWNVQFSESGDVR